MIIFWPYGNENFRHGAVAQLLMFPECGTDGVAAHACNHSIRSLRQEDLKLEDSLGYIVRPGFRKASKPGLVVTTL